MTDTLPNPSSGYRISLPAVSVIVGLLFTGHYFQTRPNRADDFPAFLAGGAYLLVTAFCLWLFFRAKKMSFLQAATSIPLIGYLGLTFFACLAALQVGHWPHYSSPDPKDVRLPFVYMVASSLWVYSTVFVVIGAVALLVMALRRHRAKGLMRCLSYYLAGIFLWGLDASHAFPHGETWSPGLFYWLID